MTEIAINDTQKVFNEEGKHIFNINAKLKPNGNVVTTLLELNGDKQMAIIQKSKGYKIQNFDSKKVSFDDMINLQILLDFNIEYLEKSPLYQTQPKLVKSENGLILN